MVKTYYCTIHACGTFASGWEFCFSSCLDSERYDVTMYMNAYYYLECVHGVLDQVNAIGGAVTVQARQLTAMRLK
jgi:hypothetical protein